VTAHGGETQARQLMASKECHIHCSVPSPPGTSFACSRQNATEAAIHSQLRRLQIRSISAHLSGVSHCFCDHQELLTNSRRDFTNPRGGTEQDVIDGKH
jgi:hypothetical protein